MFTTKINTVLLIVVLLLISSDNQNIFASTFPQDYNHSKLTNTLLDAGYLWKLNAAFHPFYIFEYDSTTPETENFKSFNWIIEYKSSYSAGIKKKKNKPKYPHLFIMPSLESRHQSGPHRQYKTLAIQPALYIAANYQENWYLRFYGRGTNEAGSLEHYSGRTKNIDRAGFDTGELDQAVLGFRNEWANVEFGRAREIWGPMAEDNLLLAGNSPPYERLALQLTFGRFAYRWFYGYLECVEADNNTLIQRYIAGRALEYNNRKNLVVSIGEVSTLAGPDRPIDWAFLNPIALHIEIETNERENDTRRNRSNDMLFLNVDFKPLNSLRLSGSFVLDEYRIDREEFRQGFDDAFGFLGHIAWTPVREPVGLTFLADGVRIDTYTFMHTYGYTNLVVKNQLIGHPLGNDADDISVGLRIVTRYRSLAEIKFGKRRWGDYSLKYEPFRNYSYIVKLPFPNGEVRENRYLKIKLLSMPHNNLHFSIDSHIDLGTGGPDSGLERATFSIRYQLPLTWTP